MAPDEFITYLLTYLPPGIWGGHVCSGASCYIWKKFLVFNVFKIFVKSTGSTVTYLIYECEFLIPACFTYTFGFVYMCIVHIAVHENALLFSLYLNMGPHRCTVVFGGGRGGSTSKETALVVLSTECTHWDHVVGHETFSAEASRCVCTGHFPSWTLRRCSGADLRGTPERSSFPILPSARTQLVRSRAECKSSPTQPAPGATWRCRCIFVARPRFETSNCLPLSHYNKNTVKHFVTIREFEKCRPVSRGKDFRVK